MFNGMLTKKNLTTSFNLPEMCAIVPLLFLQSSKIVWKFWTAETISLRQNEKVKMSK